MMAQYPKLKPYHEIEEDAGGWSDWQLWSFMAELGPHITMGSLPPFDTTIEILLPRDAALQSGESKEEK